MKLADFDAMYRDAAKVTGSQVRCEKCGSQIAVDPANCLRSGWPQCCGYTMTLIPKRARDAKEMT